MYAAYFGLAREPFSIAPDPRLLFMSERHREALAHLLYGVRGGGGFVLLTGEIGTGKTTVCRSFLDQVPSTCNLAYIFNPKLTALELLETVCHEFGVTVQARGGGAATVKDHLDPLNEFLLAAHAAGRHNLLVIDEAQNLSADVLEQLRLLTNLETSDRKLLQIILIGQPELRDLLARPELEQLAQRVIARYHLGPLAPHETVQYIRHRMEACGLKGPLPFDDGALRCIHQVSRGVPRRINLLCDRALLGAYATGRQGVDRRVVAQAAREVFGEAPAAWQMPPWVRGTALAAAAVFAVAATAYWVGRGDEATSPPGVAAVVAPARASAAARPAASAPTLLRDERDAWRELAQSWNLAPGPGADPCVAVRRQGAECFQRRIGLPLIRQLARPGIVTLDAGTQAPSYALLVALGTDSVTLRAGGTEQTVTLAAFAQRWSGEFGTLWRTPPSYDVAAARSGRGPTADWVAAQLSALRGERITARGMAPALREFQLSQGLDDDGRPGPLTLMQLNRAAGVDEPRLRQTD